MASLHFSQCSQRRKVGHFKSLAWGINAPWLPEVNGGIKWQLKAHVCPPLTQ